MTDHADDPRIDTVMRLLADLALDWPDETDAVRDRVWSRWPEDDEVWVDEEGVRHTKTLGKRYHRSKATTILMAVDAFVPAAP